MKNIITFICFAVLCIGLTSCTIYDDCYPSRTYYYHTHYPPYYRPAPHHGPIPYYKPAPHHHRHDVPHYRPNPNHPGHKPSPSVRPHNPGHKPSPSGRPHNPGHKPSPSGRPTPPRPNGR